MDLSIIIVNFNTKDLTLQCIESVKKSISKSKLKWEVIVVDNGSEDPLPLSKDYRLIKNKENLGFAKAHNQGMKIAKGNYFLNLDSDIVVKPESLDRLLQFAKTKNDGAVFGGKLLNPDGSYQASCFKLPTLTGAIKEFWFREEGSFSFYDVNSERPAVVEGVRGACFLIPRTITEKLGFFNEKYFLYFEEIDYCRKAKKAGLKIYYVPDSIFIHHVGASGKVISKQVSSWHKQSSKLYHGTLKYWLLTSILWLGQKFGEFIAPALLILLTIPAIWNLLRPGYFPMQDDLQAFRVHQMDKCFDDLQIPCRWVPDAGYQYGYPQFNYYPPLPYYVGALLHRVSFQYIGAVKVLFVSGYVLSALAMYLLVRSLLGPWAGVVAGALYTYIPYKAVEVYVRGALSEFWAQIFFPLIFWAIYKLVKTGKVKYLVWLAVSIFLLLTTHSLMSMIFAPIAIIWALFWLLRERWSNLLKVFWGGLIGFGLSAFFTLPLLFERKFAHVESLLSGYFDYRQHFVSLYRLFLSMEWGYGSSGFVDEKLNLSLGLVAWIVGLVIAPLVALLSFRKNRKTAVLTLGLSALALLSVFMMHLKSSFIWAKLSALWYLQFPWRFLAISIFLLCLLSGFVIYLSGKFRYFLGLVLVLVSIYLYLPFFVPKDWLNISDKDKFSGIYWEKQLTISIFDYLPIYATLPPWSKAPEFPEVLDGKANFLAYKKGSNYQEGEVEVEKEAILRLPLFDFPGMEVSLDGQKISHRHDDCRDERYCRGLITFDAPVGKHKIFVKLYDTPIRKAGNIISIAALGILGFLALKLKRNEKIPV